MDLVFISLQQCITRANNKSYAILEETLHELVGLIESNKIGNESVINRVSQSAAKLYNINPTKGLQLLLKLSVSEK